MTTLKLGRKGDMKTGLAACMLMLALVFFIVFSVFYIAHEAEHDCTGEDCPVCAFMHMCEDNVRSVGSGDSGAAVPASLALISASVFVMPGSFCSLSTLISDKVRLDY